MSATIAELLTAAQARLAHASASPRLDGELLLAGAIGQGRGYLHGHPEGRPDSGARRAFEAMLERRARGEPVAYLLGAWEFWSLPLQVDPNTLVPRPETELLVELALARIDALAAAGNSAPRVLDLGTGSGAIALAVAHSRPATHISATDVCPAALRTARRNAAHLKIDNVRFVSGSWFEPVAGEVFDLILSNPPYVAEDDPHLAGDGVRFEPRGALVAGADGLDAIAHIALAGPPRLAHGASLWVEHGVTQGAAVRQLFEAAGFTDVATQADLSGCERATGGTKR